MINSYARASAYVRLQRRFRVRDCNRPEWSFCLTRSQSSLSVLLSGARAVMGRTKARERDSLPPFSLPSPPAPPARVTQRRPGTSQSLCILMCFFAVQLFEQIVSIEAKKVRKGKRPHFRSPSVAQKRLCLSRPYLQKSSVTSDVNDNALRL